MPYIRLKAFQAIDAVLLTYETCIIPRRTPMELIEIEIQLWRDYLPYAFKCSEKEYLSQMLRCLTSLLNRISTTYLEYDEHHGTDTDSTSNLLTEFVIDFLLNDIFIKQAAYPGTVLEKERFALSMFKCIVSFVSQDDMNITSNTATEPIKKNITRTKRKIHIKQQTWLTDILKATLVENILLTLMSLLHSMWDASRTFAYDLICDLAHLSKIKQIQLPFIFCSDGSRELIYARAIHLASSPRQREADTGARILAILCFTLPDEEQSQYIDDLCTILTDRITMMKCALGIVLGVKENYTGLSTKHEYSHTRASELPLAHGLIQSLRLMIEYVSFNPQTSVLELFERMVATCCRAIEVSLTVVADMKDDNVDQIQSKENQTWKVARLGQGCTPLNVNTGAIGANATFASVGSSDSKDEDEMGRFVTQRVVVSDKYRN